MLDSTKGAVLVVGGGGYIGSHAALSLVRAGYRVAIYDNFCSGNRDIAERTGAHVVQQGDLADREVLRHTFETFKPSAVMHFAALAYVGESMQQPDRYYRNNVSYTINLLDEMVRHAVRYFIFSSTCATYGIPERVPINESTPQVPINPYGRSKLMVEQILNDYNRAFGLRSVIFRYFNAAGADSHGDIGERHQPETHLIPLAILAALGQGELHVFGDDYPTVDGTCIRDYIHVSDIIRAHILGLEYLVAGESSEVFNVGIGQGHSVFQVLREVERVSQRKVPYVMKSRRSGDSPALVASAEKINGVLGWIPEFPELSRIVKSAYDWHVKDMAHRGKV